VEATDLFHGIEVVSALGNTAQIFTFECGDTNASDFIKWAICNRFNVQGRWKDEGKGKITLFLEVCNSSVKALRKLAETMAGSFAELWREFNALPGSTLSDARLFMRGLHDGMMNDEREPGEPLPRRSVRPVKQRGGRSRALAFPSGVAIHPYSVALGIGRKIRLMVPAVELTAELRAAEELARLTTSERIA
jgi:hypothetical protein